MRSCAANCWAAAEVSDQGAIAERALVPPEVEDHLATLVVFERNLCIDLRMLAVSAEVAR